MYAKIMVAVDGSSIATRALDEVLRMAPAQGTTLILVHVIEYPHIYVRDLGYDPAPITEALLSDGRRVLEDAAARVKSRHIEYRSVMVDKRTTTDSIAERLQRVADEQQVELVVLGTHGRGGFKRLLLGSVAEACLRSSSRPVLLVPGGQHDDGVQS